MFFSLSLNEFQNCISYLNFKIVGPISHLVLVTFLRNIFYLLLNVNGFFLSFFLFKDKVVHDAPFILSMSSIWAAHSFSILCPHFALIFPLTIIVEYHLHGTPVQHIICPSYSRQSISAFVSFLWASTIFVFSFLLIFVDCRFCL